MRAAYLAENCLDSMGCEISLVQGGFRQNPET